MAKRGIVKIKTIRDEIDRPLRVRKYKHFFLIVCEDEKCEPTYFNQFKNDFPEHTLFLMPIGTGRDQLGVVRMTVEIIEKFKTEHLREIDDAWAVFDKDNADNNEATINNFNQAYLLAEQHNIEIAFSNECFELWLLLHLTQVEYENAVPRQNIYDQLQERLREIDGYAEYEYEHGGTDIIDAINAVGNERNAIERAKELIVFHNEKPPIEANPSTTVFKLVEELREWIKYYQYEA